MSQLFLSGTISTSGSQNATAGLTDQSGKVFVTGMCTNGEVISAFITVNPGLPNCKQYVFSNGKRAIFSALAELSNGTVIAVGNSSNGDNKQHMWLVNVGADGTVLWEANVSNGFEKVAGSGVVATADGGFVAVAMIGSDDLQRSMVTKYACTTDGGSFTEVWTTVLDGVTGYSIANAEPGSYLISGSVMQTGNDIVTGNPVAIFIDDKGEILNKFVFSDVNVIMLDNATSVRTKDGNYVYAGVHCLMKFSPAGKVVWVWGLTENRLWSVLELSNGNLVFGGYNVSNIQQGYAYVVCTDAGGNNIVWDNSDTISAVSAYNCLFTAKGGPSGEVVWAVGTSNVTQTISQVNFVAFNPTSTISSSSSN